MRTWIDMQIRLKKNETIDKKLQVQIIKEKEHWKLVLVRIISVMRCLAKGNLAFRGENEKIYQDNNGNFLGLLELIAEFYLVLQEHFRCSKVRSDIIEKIKEAKYFSVILGCTTDCLELDINNVSGQDHVHGLTLKPLSTTRWESHINSVKAIITQTDDIREALFELSRVSEEAKTKSEAESLAAHGLESFEFLLGMNYRETSALFFAKEIASKMEIDPMMEWKSKQFFVYN
ncbi:uncharacterized protein LOC18786711 [Prunus persica]|uniref:uncharacterized protein LOC18786711 n=1 Tax=Prunus persica TaxID=3760 RepID=UPI0009ABA4EC|nr:uncharacterized protein LOC18786711 [Prunus persica]